MSRRAAATEDFYVIIAEMSLSLFLVFAAQRCATKVLYSGCGGKNERDPFLLHSIVVLLVVNVRSLTARCSFLVEPQKAGGSL